MPVGPRWSFEDRWHNAIVIFLLGDGGGPTRLTELEAERRSTRGHRFQAVKEKSKTVNTIVIARSQTDNVCLCFVLCGKSSRSGFFSVVSMRCVKCSTFITLMSGQVESLIPFSVIRKCRQHRIQYWAKFRRRWLSELDDGSVLKFWNGTYLHDPQRGCVCTLLTANYLHSTIATARHG
jgi:hypothetical protein